MKKYLFIACALFIISCSENRKQSIKDTSVLLKEITDDYYQERMRYFLLRLRQMPIIGIMICCRLISAMPI